MPFCFVSLIKEYVFKILGVRCQFDKYLAELETRETVSAGSYFGIFKPADRQYVF